MPDQPNVVMTARTIAAIQREERDLLKHELTTGPGLARAAAELELFEHTGVPRGGYHAIAAAVILAAFGDDPGERLAGLSPEVRP